MEMELQAGPHRTLQVLKPWEDHGFPILSHVVQTKCLFLKWHIIYICVEIQIDFQFAKF